MRFLDLLPFVLSAGAFLLPTEVEEPVYPVEKIPSAAEFDTVTLDCVGGCPIGLAQASKNGVPTVWSTSPTGQLVADLAVQEKKVLLNGQQIFPPNGAIPLSMRQRTDDDVSGLFTGLIPVSTSLEYKPVEVLFDSTTNMKLHRIHIEVLAVANQVVHAQKLIVRVAETENGLGLLNSRRIAYVPSPFTDECTTVWCRVKGTLAQKFNEFRQAAGRKIHGWRGCNGRKAHNGLRLKGGPAKFGPGSSLAPHEHHKGDKEHGKHHHHHHHHHGGHRSFLGRFMAFINPAIPGLLAGLFTYSLSYFLLKCWIHYCAQRRAVAVEQAPPAYVDIERQPQEESEDEKKELLQ